MKIEALILNLGSGKTRIPKAINVDNIKIPQYTDVVYDLDKIPYPFNDNSVDEVHMYHVIEHLHNPLEKIEEIYRILKPGGLLHLRAPHFSSLGAFTDITHLRPFGIYSFDCFDPLSYHHFYTTAKFKIINKKIKYLGLYPNNGVYEKYIHPNSCPYLLRPFVRLIDLLISISPFIFERIWCYWVGGATEIIVDMKKI